MHVTPEQVEHEYRWVHNRAPSTVEQINDLRARFSDVFGTSVDPVTVQAYRNEVDVVFANGPQAVNVAGLIGLLKELDVDGDYPGFVVDEFLGRDLAATIAGTQPFGLLASASFHYVDIEHHPDGGAGLDDLEAALVAGFQARLPGWNWTEGDSAFAVSAAIEDR